MKALIVKTEGAVESIEIDGLRDKQRAVGGCIEYFGVFEDRGFTVIINEDGLFHLPAEPRHIRRREPGGGGLPLPVLT